MPSVYNTISYKLGISDYNFAINNLLREEYFIFLVLLNFQSTNLHNLMSIFYKEGLLTHTRLSPIIEISEFSVSVSQGIVD